MSEVIIKAYPPLRLAGLRHVGPYPSMGRTFEKLGPLSGLQGLFGPDTKTVAVTYDDPKLVPEAALRTDCCITLAARASIAEPLQEIIIGEGLRASWRHIGPYTELGSQWMAFIKALTAMAPDERPAPSQKPCFEIYHNDPRTTPPAELVTELFVPLD